MKLMTLQNLFSCSALAIFLLACPSQQVKVDNPNKIPLVDPIKKVEESVKEGGKTYQAKGQMAPAFELNDLDDNSHTLAQYKGKVVIVNFWATWCGPCKKEFPHLDRILKTHKEKGLVILAISTDEASSASQIGPMVSRYGYQFTVLHDKDGSVISLYNPKKHCPYTVVVDRKGQIRMSHQGYTPGDEKPLEKRVIDLLKEAP